jgi:RNAse (barnase) inhibitor barstar
VDNEECVRSNSAEDKEVAGSEQYLKGCLEGVSLYLSKWPAEIRVAREAADGVWQVLPQIEIIRPLSIGYYVFERPSEEILARLRDQITYLLDAGHKVTVFSRGSDGSVFESWFDSDAPEKLPERFEHVAIPHDNALSKSLSDQEVIIGTSWKALWDLMLCTTAEPVAFEFEERPFNLFNDPMAFGSMMELPVSMACVSEPVLNTLLLYGRNSLVLSSNEDVERVISMFGRMHRQSGKNAT